MLGPRRVISPRMLWDPTRASGAAGGAVTSVTHWRERASVQGDGTAIRKQPGPYQKAELNVSVSQIRALVMFGELRGIQVGDGVNGPIASQV